MNAFKTRTTANLGMVFGYLCALLSISFTFLMLLDVLHIFGGTLQLVPVLLLAPCYLILIACIFESIIPEKRIWSLLALCFSIAYSVTVSFNYMMQLTVVPHNPSRYSWLAMEFHSDSMFGAIELLGYSWQCLALVTLVPLFKKSGKELLLRYLLLVNGLLAGCAVVTDIVTGDPMHIIVMISLGFWSISFPVITILIGYWIYNENRLK